MNNKDESSITEITPDGSVVPIYLAPFTQEEIEERQQWEEAERLRAYAAIKELRRLEYASKSDPLYFGWQRGENTEQDWLDAVQAVKDANPYPEPTEA